MTDVSQPTFMTKSTTSSLVDRGQLTLASPVASQCECKHVTSVNVFHTDLRLVLTGISATTHMSGLEQGLLRMPKQHDGVYDDHDIFFISSFHVWA